MITIDEFRKLAMAFDQVEEMPHHDKTSFRIKKKIFATLNAKENRACLKFTELDQFAFCAFDKTVIYPVPNKFGKQGWTLVNLKKIQLETLVDALQTAFCTVAPKLIADKYKV